MVNRLFFPKAVVLTMRAGRGEVRAMVHMNYQTGLRLEAISWKDKRVVNLLTTIQAPIGTVERKIKARAATKRKAAVPFHKASVDQPCVVGGL